GDNLRKSNVISRLAEDFGEVIFKLTGQKPINGTTALRDAVNNFKYVNPSSLPKEAPFDRLSSDCHSFGRIFTGALYDIFMMIYEDIRATGIPPVVAIKEARDIVTRYVLKAIQNAPLNVKFFNSLAKTIL